MEATCYQRPPFIYGEILSRSAYASESVERSELPGIGRFLSQGAAAGAGVFFLICVFLILSEPDNSWNILIVFILPLGIAYGTAIGLFQGVLTWGCTRLVRRHLSWILRAGIGVSMMTILWVVTYQMSPAWARSETSELKDYVWAIGIYLSTGVTYGLITGSRLQPWRALVRGMEPKATGSRWLSGITGLLLRLLVVFCFMESILWFICILQSSNKRFNIVIGAIAVCHFAAASVIIFTKLEFWLLLPLAVIINLPVIPLLTEMIPDNALFAWYSTVTYLGVWAAFLLTRWRPLYSAFSVINQEIHYYLID